MAVRKTLSAADEYVQSGSNTDFLGNVLGSAAIRFSYFGGTARRRVNIQVSELLICSVV